MCEGFIRDLMEDLNARRTNISPKIWRGDANRYYNIVWSRKPIRLYSVHTMP